MNIKTSNKFVYLALFIFLSYFMSWWGGYITDYFKEPWYSTIIKPSFNPPDWVFAPIWMSLYLLIGYASWLMWSSRNKTQKILNIYFIHLIFNASWTVTFFAFHQILVSLIIVGLIIFFVVWLIKLYYPINKISAYLMLPYLSWLCFAFVLNYSIFALN
ncbi:tryptophan-rich sensory protein [Candidatus Pelagibacter sp.]|nr:tryptophan-rich sensory protein [Candidatus Pelagibacter sp.]